MGTFAWSLKLAAGFSSLCHTAARSEQGFVVITVQCLFHLAQLLLKLTVN